MAIVGIDLGTTNSLIGVIEKGRPRLFQSETGGALIPSVVGFLTGGEPLVGTAAEAKKGDENPYGRRHEEIRSRTHPD